MEGGEKETQVKSTIRRIDNRGETKKKMAPKKIILIRHGQAQHNIDPPKNYGIADPRLTELGEGQCRKIKIGVDVVCGNQSNIGAR